MYEQYRYHRIFGGAPPWGEMSAHLTDWFIAFERMDDEVEAWLVRKANEDAAKQR
jgi:hypothetical protein